VAPIAPRIFLKAALMFAASGGTTSSEALIPTEFLKGTSFKSSATSSPLGRRIPQELENGA
jgi:hypothetical protein